jgi:hypothetical protein
MKKTMANVTHLVRLAAIGTATASLSVAGMIPPAHASASVPTCIKVSINKGIITQTATVTNRCSTTYRVKVIWAYAPDSPCVQLPRNYYFKSTAAITARFDGLKSC